MEKYVTELIKQLEDPDESSRIMAVEELGFVRDDGVIDPLVAALHDSARSVAETAADALIMIGTEKVAEAISPLLSREESSLRNDAAEILEHLKDVAIPTLVKSLENRDHDVRQFAVDTLSKINSPEALPFVAKLLNDPNENVAASAIETLGSQGGENDVPAILKQIERSSWIKGTCLRSLGKIGSKNAVDAILKQTSDSDPLVLFSSIQALGVAASPDGITELIQILDDKPEIFGEEVIQALNLIFHNQSDAEKKKYLGEVSPEPFYKVAKNGSLKTRLSSIDLLSDFPGEGHLEFLLELYSDPNSEIRKTALNATVNLNPPDLIPVLDMLQSSALGMEAKAAAIDTLGRIKREGLLPAIVEYLDSEDIILQRVALNALYPPLDKVVNDKLRELLKSPINEIRMHAIMAIGRIGNTDFMKDIIEMLDDDDEEVRDAADDAFVFLAEHMEPLVVPFLNSFDQEERRRAFQFLSHHTFAEMEPQLIKGLDADDPQIRIIAIKAILNINPEGAGELIWKSFNDTDESVVLTAIWAFGELKAQKYREFLEDFLSKTDNSRYIYQLLLSLGQIGDSSSVAILQKYIAKEDTYLKFAAIEALQRIGSDSAFEALDEAYDNEDDSEILTLIEEALSSRE